jgi:small conductance mechanosensitive channel
MVVKGQIKTRPLQQWSVARAFNLRLKRKMDEAGIEIPVAQMRVYTSSKDSEGEPLRDDEMTGFVAPMDAGADDIRHAHGDVHQRARDGGYGKAPQRAHEPTHERSREAAHEYPREAEYEVGVAGPSARASTHVPLAPARDVSHEPRPAPPTTGQTAPIPPQIPTAGDAGGKS